MEKYQITKTIRFKLEAENDHAKKMKGELPSEDFSFASFIIDLKNFLDNIKSYLFYQKKDKSFAVKDKMIIKNNWLKQYAKQEFAEFKSMQKNSNATIRRTQTLISDIDGLSTKIKNAIDEVDTIYSELASDAGAGLNERSKKARTGLFLKRLSAKKALPLLISLVENTADKNEKDNLSVRLKNQAEKLNKQLLTGIEAYLPEQASGLPIAKASFNYYTINKTPIDYAKNIGDLKNSLNIELSQPKFLNIGKNHQNLLKQIFRYISVDIKKELGDNKLLLLGDAPFAENYVSLRQILKNIKAKQKATFNEFMQNANSFVNFSRSNDLYLFSTISEQEFNEYKEKTEQIEGKATDINQCTDDTIKKQLRSDLQQLKRVRGALINAADRNNNEKFKTYKEFVNFYRAVSQKHGRVLAKLKGIERERTESQLLNYWATIIEIEGQYKLALIPKEKAAEYKKCLEKADSTAEQPKIFWFESFTFRSLQKLCFGNINSDTKTNTFYSGIANELQYKYFEKDNFISGEFFFKGDEQKKIEFYKDVLNSKYAQTVLKLPVSAITANIIDRQFEKLDDFKIALEKICYSRYVCVSNDVLNKIQGDSLIYNITSLDLRNAANSKNKSIVFSHSDKQHTQIWKKFWSANNENKNFEIRLNPEITITYRKPKESRVAKYGEASKLYDKKKNNRYLREQFTLCTTFTENALTPEINFAFKDVQTKGQAILDFNKRINSKLNSCQYFYGIDAGEVEFATVALAKKEGEKFTPQTFTTYVLRNLNFEKQGYLWNNGNPILREKPYRAIQNLSYFLDRNLYKKTFHDDKFDEVFQDLFEEKKVSALDLTTAKLISGKIILNGDIATLLRLKILHAERKIYQKLISNSNAVLKEENFKLFFEDEPNKIIFISRKDFECIKPYDVIKQEMFAYFKDKQKDTARTESRINDYRKSLVGNMIGVINFLYGQYSGIIAIENLMKNKVESDRLTMEGNIERPLEWALYKKFQTDGLVPPISELIALRELEKFEFTNGKQKVCKSLQQFGIIKFVSEQATSITCPACAENAYRSSSDDRYITDKNKKEFSCQKCKFHNKTNAMGYESLDTNDKVAAYNIAKRGYLN